MLFRSGLFSSVYRRSPGCDEVGMVMVAIRSVPFKVETELMLTDPRGLRRPTKLRREATLLTRGRKRMGFCLRESAAIERVKGASRRRAMVRRGRRMLVRLTGAMVVGYERFINP